MTAKEFYYVNEEQLERAVEQSISIQRRCNELLAELLSLRAEVDRMRAKLEQRDRLLDRFTANNIKLNQELEKLWTTLTVLRIDHNHETCAYDLAYWYRFHGDCCTGCGENLHLPHPLANLYPHFTGACRAALSEARKET